MTTTAILLAIAPGWAMLSAFLVSLTVCVLIVLTKKWHGRYSIDGMEGVQKVHKAPTPRVGGLGIYLGVLAALPLMWGEAFDLMAMIALAGIPAFLSGFIEDITKKVSARWRLVATIVSGLIFAIPMGFGFDLADMQWLYDGEAFSYAAAIAIVAIGMGGVANAINITDGYNGLASGSVIIMALTYAALASMVGDIPLAMVCLVIAACLGGFFLVNWPFGKIFLGDAGAYFAGVALSSVAVMITARNTEISPFVSMLVLFYPIYETLFSIWRKSRRVGHSPMRPDGVHLHALISRTMARPLARKLRLADYRNPIAGAMMWPFPLICGLMAIASFESGRGAAVACTIFALLYGRIYLIASLQAVPFTASRRTKADAISMPEGGARTAQPSGTADQ